MVGSKGSQWQRVHGTGRPAFPSQLGTWMPSWVPDLQRRCDALGHLGLWGPLCGWGQDAGIRIFTDLVCLRSRMVYPETVSWRKICYCLKFLIKLTESVIGAGLPLCLSALVAWFLKITKPWIGLGSSKASAYNSGDLGLIPGWGGYPREGNGNPRQHPCLENPMDRRDW